MGALTEHTPKPMLLVSGRPFLEYIIENTPEKVDEIVFIVGHLGEIIKNNFGDIWKGKKIRYVWQTELKGTGPALWLTKDILHGKFLVLYADDMYPKADLEKCIEKDWSLLVLKQESLTRGGKVVINEKGELMDIIESNNHGGEAGVLNAGVYVLQPEIFKYELVKTQDKEEWGLPQTIISASKDHPISVVETHSRISITSPEDLETAERLIKSDFLNK